MFFLDMNWSKNVGIYLTGFTWEYFGRQGKMHLMISEIQRLKTMKQDNLSRTRPSSGLFFAFNLFETFPDVLDKEKNKMVMRVEDKICETL